MRMVFISCKFPDKLAEDLRRLAREKGVSVSELVRKAVAELIVEELSLSEEGEAC